MTFPTLNPVVLNDMEGQGAHGEAGAAKGSVEAIAARGEGVLFVPDGDGPWPAVVLLEGLGGLKESREIGYGRMLAERGYMTLTVNSFGPRNAGGNHTWRALQVTESMMLADAYAGLRLLRARADVDVKRIATLGFSYGGMISMLTAYEQIRRLFASEDDECFAGHICFYGCSVPRAVNSRTTGAPVKILLGGLDRNVSVERTEQIAQDLRQGGSDVQLTVYDNVYHQWDGKDDRKRFVRFSLCNVRMLIERDGTIRDERTGLRISSRLSRMVALAWGVSLGGYHIKRDEDTIRRSHEDLFAFLASLGRGPGPDRKEEPAEECVAAS